MTQAYWEKETAGLYHTSLGKGEGGNKNKNLLY